MSAEKVPKLLDKQKHLYKLHSPDGEWNENSRLTALLNYSGVSSFLGFLWQPVHGNSSTPNISQSLGYRNKFVCNAYSSYPSYGIANSQTAPNFRLHELLTVLSSHKALQNPVTQGYLTKLANSKRYLHPVNEAIVQKITTAAQNNKKKESHGTSSITPCIQGLFRFNSVVTQHFHAGPLYSRRSFWQFSGVYPSRGVMTAAAAATGISSIFADRTSPEAMSLSSPDLSTQWHEITSEQALSPSQQINSPVSTINGYTVQSPQGYALMFGRRANGRRDVRIQRSEFSKTFLQYYINLGTSRVNLSRQLRVFFTSDDGEFEPAADAGGPRGEYIGMLREQIKYGVWDGLPLFDYGGNGILPSQDSFLGDASIFFAVGLAFSDLIFNSGSSIDGLSVHCISALKQMHAGNYPCIHNVKKSEILDEDVKDAFEMLSLIGNKSIYSCPDLQKLQRLCAEWKVDIPDDLNYRSALRKRNSLVQAYFIRSRISALWDLFEGLRAGGIMLYLKMNPKKWESLFPRQGSIVVTAQDLMNNLIFQDIVGNILNDHDGHEMENYELTVRQYITDIAGDATKIKQFLMCCTGFDVLTPGKIFVAPQSDPGSEQVQISACAKLIVVPIRCTVEYFAEAMSLALDYNRG